MRDSDPVRRLCAAVAVRQRPPATDLHRRMVSVVQHACLAAGLDRLFLQEHGTDGVVLVMPSGVSEVRVTADLVAHLHDALACHAPPLRLVIAFHQGITTVSTSGIFGGQAVSAAWRLCSDERLHGALAEGHSDPLAVVISDDLISADTPADDMTEFQRISVDFPGRPVTAWIHRTGTRFRIPGIPQGDHREMRRNI